jgi:RNA polymerase sigma-70 factor (ECF subfamily)
MPEPAAPGRAEAALVLAAAQGDAVAYEALVRPQLGMLFRVIDRILGNEAESQDALQDALLTITGSCRASRGPASSAPGPTASA